MNEPAESSVPAAQYIAVEGVDYALAPGCQRTFTKHLLTTERLHIQQTLLRGAGDAEDGVTRAVDTAAYVLAGSARLKNQERTLAGKGHLILILAGARWSEQLAVTSEELVLLEIARAGDRAARRDERGTAVRAVNPDDVQPYEPAGHAKTRNRCLFVDEHMEIIEGMIERGGGAERHSHRDHEQLLYVLAGVGVPLLIHYPKGAPHGTGGGIAEPLELLVIYSPPLGESHNALG
jgi:uncharacterized RmlC-like cupin family protein